MKLKRKTIAGVPGLLADPRVLCRAVDDEVWYLATGVVQVLTESDFADEYWRDLKTREPVLETFAHSIDFQASDGQTVWGDGLTLDGVLRVVQSISSPRAEKIKRWLIQSARQRLDELENPELALVRARKIYEQRGYSDRWISKRLRAVTARQELTGEWSHRGASESDDYRTLTNELIQSAFGMDVEHYRNYKGVDPKRENLRDHMTDLELALVTLAETTAAELHRQRNSAGLAKLEADVNDAGRIVASTLAQIEQKVGKPVVQPRFRQVA